MAKHSKHISTRMSAERVKLMLKKEFEPGRQDKCKLAVFRNVISKQTGISERTFWRYLNEIEAEAKQEEDPNQLKLF